MLKGRSIPHPPSTNFNDDFPSPPSKRLKRDQIVEHNSPVKTSSPRRTFKEEIPDSEDEEGLEDDFKTQPRTQLETTLPQISTDAEAIEAYEAYKAGQSDQPTLQQRLEKGTWTKGRSSIYVDAFNLALETVLEDESHLFNEVELDLLRQWKALCYESQYLYVRLFLRKTSAWHRIAKLGYYSDIADLSGAVADLLRPCSLPEAVVESQDHPGELEPPPGLTLSSSFTWAECSSDHISTLDEASSLLLLDELKEIAKQAKVNGKNKRELLQNLRRTSGKQGGLGFKRSDTEESTGSALSDGSGLQDEEGASEPDGTITPSHRTNRDAHFTRKILGQTGQCIRLSLAPVKLFERVHLVFYRSTEWTEKSLTTLILAKISRRNFPQYLVSRSASIFESRDFLLEFEASLRTQFKVDNILEFNGTPGKRQFEEVKIIFEAVYPRWKVLLAKEQDKENRVYDGGEGAYLRRFSPAWVYTRIVHKGLQPLARFKEHQREHDILCELLEQRLFHAARRGAWYSRRALLEEHYIHALVEQPSNLSGEAWKKEWKRRALRTCEEGLEDRDCHIIYHYDLQKRIRKIERQLHLPLREQHDFGHTALAKAVERTIEGIRLEKDSQPGDRPRTPTHAGGKTLWLDTLDTGEPVSVESFALSFYRTTHGFKGYHSEGGILRHLFGLLFFDVLFDPASSYVPNVFQTAYQTCPLDLHTDAFYPARIREINERINQIEAGQASAVIQEVWDREVENKTCVVGIRWDDYGLTDVLEIVKAFGGVGLGVVMRVMAQDYASRGGGVPDLIVWKPGRSADGDEEHERKGTVNGNVTPDETKGKGDGEVMFVEVKSENDRLSDTQRLWISVLLGAGIKVELCHVLANEVRKI